MKIFDAALEVGVCGADRTINAWSRMPVERKGNSRSCGIVVSLPVDRGVHVEMGPCGLALIDADSKCLHGAYMDSRKQKARSE